MYYTIEDLVEKFIKEKGEKYSHLSDKEIHSICTSQFQEIKEGMENGMEDIRLKYLFVVRVMYFRVLKYIGKTWKYYSDGITKEKDFIHYANLLLDYVQKNPTKFEKYYETIREITGFTKEEISKGAYKENPGKRISNLN
jgi:hypothetical protein